MHTSQWYASSDVAGGMTGVMATMLAEINPVQHDTCADYLYADGHAATVPMNTFQNWVQSDMSVNVQYPTAIVPVANFARPLP